MSKQITQVVARNLQHDSCAAGFGGNPVPAPQWFVDALPRQPLDGELWLGRGSFDQLSAIVRRQMPVDAEWRQVRYMIICGLLTWLPPPNNQEIPEPYDYSHGF